MSKRQRYRHVQEAKIQGDSLLPLLLQLVHVLLEGSDLVVDPPKVSSLLPHLLPVVTELPQPGSPLGPALGSSEGPYVTGWEARLSLRTECQLKSQA